MIDPSSMKRLRHLLESQESVSFPDLGEQSSSRLRDPVLAILFVVGSGAAFTLFRAIVDLAIAMDLELTLSVEGSSASPTLTVNPLRKLDEMDTEATQLASFVGGNRRAK